MCPETPDFPEYFCIFQYLLTIYKWKRILDEDRFYFDYFKFVVERNIVAFKTLPCKQLDTSRKLKESLISFKYVEDS